MDQYAVLGNPVKHSLSPRIHALFSEQTGQLLNYQALEAPVDGFAAFTSELHQQGYQGMNVTVPFKGDAWDLSESLSDRATAAAAVNTLIRTTSGWRGDNTDGVGLLNDLTCNIGIDLTNKRILILGAGGAVRGVILPLLSAQPAVLHIANRTAGKATALAGDFNHPGTLTGSGLDGPFRSQYDLIINGTAASLQGIVPAIPEGLLAAGASCYDMMYSSKPTAFVQWAQKQGAKRSVDGLGMLVEQAAESFFLWRGIRPDTGPILELIRQT